MEFYIRPTWPSTRDEFDFWDGLAVTVEHDVVRVWLFEPGIYWKRVRLVRKNEVSLTRVFCEVGCLLFEYKTGQGLSQRSDLLSSPSHIQHHDIASSPDTLSSPESAARCNSGELMLDWRRQYDTYFYDIRHLARMCRLVCRDWAKQLPLGGPMLRIANDAVWYCVEDLWRVLPKRHWAWEFREIEWWAEPRHQDKRTWKDCKAWYPKLIRPIDDSEPSTSQETSTPSSFFVTSKQYRTHLEPSFGRPFLGHVRDMDERELYRRCRLVCRNWARQFSATDPERGKLWLREGVMWYMMDGDWRVLPRGYWAWALQDVEWWAERFCAELSGCTKTGCRCKGWYPKLLQPVDDTIRENAEYPTPMERPPKCKSRALNTASLLPPELFDYICKAADSESRSCRLVCRYWNRQCTPHVFEIIAIRRSPERIRALWKVRVYPMLRQYVEIIDGVPVYDNQPKFPWIHLLTQICTSTQAVWRLWNDKEAHISLQSISKRIRSIHDALPRSVPRSFSCGIRSLLLFDVKVRQMVDLTHLACELPDLEELWCSYLTFDSLPAELPRRRPRKSRNKLKDVFLETNVAGAEFMPPLVIPVLGLFLGAYDVASFLSDEEAAVISATLFLAPSNLQSSLACDYDAQTRQLEFSLINNGPALRAQFRFKVSSARNTTTLQVGINVGSVHEISAYYSHPWKDLDSMFGRLRSGSLEVCTQVVFGFKEREDMVYFAENVLGQLPSISEHFTVQYSIYSWKAEDESRYWYQASLDSEELRGEPDKSLLDVYP